MLGVIVVELYPEARKLLDSARIARTPSVEDRERVFAALMASVAVTAVAPTAAAAKTAAAKTGFFGKIAGNALWIKAAASVAVISAASASTVAYVRHREALKTASSHVPVAVAASALPLSIAPSAQPDLEPTAQVAKVEAPLVPTAVTRALPTTEHAAPVSNPPLSAALAHNAEGPSVELSLLRQAQAARRAGQPGRALELAHEHAEKYPRSRLWAERETLRVLALCDLGRVDAARRSAAQLQYLWSSPLRATLNASCVGK